MHWKISGSDCSDWFLWCSMFRWNFTCFQWLSHAITCYLYVDMCRLFLSVALSDCFWSDKNLKTVALSSSLCQTSKLQSSDCEMLWVESFKAEANSKQSTLTSPGTLSTGKRRQKVNMSQGHTIEPFKHKVNETSRFKDLQSLWHVPFVLRCICNLGSIT